LDFVIYLAKETMNRNSKLKILYFDGLLSEELPLIKGNVTNESQESTSLLAKTLGSKMIVNHR